LFLHFCWYAAAYLECARGPRESGDGSFQWALGAEVTLFVNEYQNFDVLEEKISKISKTTIIKNYRRGRRKVL